MKNIGKIVPVLAVMGFLVLMVFPVNAIPDTAKNLPVPGAGEKGGKMSAHLDRLEEQGYDMTEIRNAIESGDMETARTLMQAFMEEHRDELPATPAGIPAGNGERMSAHLDRLEEQGYDMTEIRNAIESGDLETARTLMQAFMEEHRDELPAPTAGDRAFRGGHCMKSAPA